MPRLVAHPGTSGLPDLHYTDFDLGGAVCCTQDEAAILHNAAASHNPRMALEIGSYVGWSAAHIARAFRGKLFCLETFSELGEGVSPEQAKMRFAENIARMRQDGCIELVCGRSPDVIGSIAPAGGFDFVFIDGDHHDRHPLQDVAGVMQYLSPTGLIALHDLWEPDVLDAAKFLKNNGFNVEIFSTANYLGFAWRGELPWWSAFQRQVDATLTLHEAHQERGRRLAWA